MAPRRGVALGLFAALVLGACGMADRAEHGCGLEGTVALPGHAAEIAFACDLEPSSLYHGDILAVRLGERARMLTHGEGGNRDPRWSPDGTRIAFMSTRSGVEQLYVINADGVGVVQLTHSAGFKGGVDWSPDGTRIAFASSEAGTTGLMAQGRTNSAIGSCLHLSPKTVEGHIRNIFMRLQLEPAEDDHRRVLAVVTYLRA
jgi:dipeptidyl aminopeptidase/acylaminoacyl peptidase